MQKLSTRQFFATAALGLVALPAAVSAVAAAPRIAVHQMERLLENGTWQACRMADLKVGDIVCKTNNLCWSDTSEPLKASEYPSDYFRPASHYHTHRVEQAPIEVLNENGTKTWGVVSHGVGIRMLTRAERDVLEGYV